MRIPFHEWALRQAAYLRLWARVPTPPMTLHVEPSGACNLKCGICPQSVAVKRPVAELLMPMETFDRVLGQARGLFREVYFAVGGEPLMHPDLHVMIGKAKAAGLETTVHTNATLLTRRRSEELIDAGLDRITMNILDTEEEYERVREGAKFEATVRSIRMFLETRRDLGRGPSVTLQAVKPHVAGSPEEARILPQFLQRFEPFTIDRVLCFWAHHFGGDFAEKATLEYAEMQRTGMYYPCQEAWTALMVSHNGEVRPCCIDLTGAYPLGNVAEGTLREMWNGERMQTLRRNLASGKVSKHPLCRNCEMLWRGPWQKKSAGGAGRVLFGVFGKKIRPE